MAIFRFNNNNFEKAEQTKFSSERILERQHIQNALKKRIEDNISNNLKPAFGEMGGNNK